MSRLQEICLNEFVKELIINSTNLEELKNFKQQEQNQEDELQAQAETETPQEQIQEKKTQDNNSIISQIIEMLNQDKKVEKIECPGPDKPFLILKNNMIEPIQFSLTKEEIENIIQDTATQTSTTINSGILTTKIENWSFVGIISEFGGSRFIIQKTRL